MSFMKEYASSILIVSILSILLESILPEGNHKKYIRVIIGLLVMLVILNPLKKLPHYSDSFYMPHLRLGDNELSYSSGKPYIALSFEKNLSQAISEDVYKKFSKVIACRVYTSVNQEGQITGIEKITVEPFETTVSEYIESTYGLTKGCVINGG